MSLPNVPDSVSRRVPKALCEELGLDAGMVQALEFGVYGLYVTFHATNGEGRKLADGRGAAQHRIYIPYTEEGVP